MLHRNKSFENISTSSVGRLTYFTNENNFYER